MSQQPTLASKTWRALRRTASGLGGSHKSTDGGPVKLPSHRASTEPAHEAKAAQSVHAPPVTLPTSREAFLEAYDAATLRGLNRLNQSSAACVADVPLQQVASWNRTSGFLGHLTGSQQEALDQMRSWFPESRRWHTDHDLLRFLRAREFDSQKTRQMYSKYISEYRGREMVSPRPVIRPILGVLQNDLLELYPEREAGLSGRLQKLMDCFLHTMAFGVDSDGRPVVYFRPADIVRQSMIKHVPLEDRIAFQSAANEALFVLVRVASRRAGCHIENITQLRLGRSMSQGGRIPEEAEVLDLSGMSAVQMVTHMRSHDAQQEWQHNLDYVPELLHKVYVINAPSGMSIVWKVASYFLPAQTKRKINVLGSSYRSELQTAIGVANLPSCYGGRIPFEWQKHRSIKDFHHK